MGIGIVPLMVHGQFGVVLAVGCGGNMELRVHRTLLRNCFRFHIFIVGLGELIPLACTSMAVEISAVEATKPKP